MPSGRTTGSAGRKPDHTDFLEHDLDGLVFRALNDGGRRRLLDALFVDDGQTLTQMSELLPSMTRYGVMNHLRVCEDAGLITTIRDGRSKRHYLNPVPIRAMHDRWIAKFTEPVVASHRYQSFIDCTPDDAWDAIINPAKTVQYFFGTSAQSAWTAGDEIQYLAGDGGCVASGEILAIDPPNRIQMTFLPMWDPVLTDEGHARMAWIVDTANGLTRVTVEYYDLDPLSKQAENFMDGIPFIVGGLKTLLETGRALTSSPSDYE